MAIGTTTLSPQLGGKVYNDTAATNSVVAAVSGATTIYHIEFDNTSNAAVTYLKMYESGSVTLGTTQPSFIIKAAASTKEYMSFPTGLSHASAIQYIATTTASNSAGSPSAPSAVCGLTILYT
tara:strand:+ start:11 stop:379 length:369 start_codon:yes stop_codon:yes gene_type:complete